MIQATSASSSSRASAPDWVRELTRLDLSRIASQFQRLLRPDPAQALAFWAASLPLVPQPLRVPLGRLVDERMSVHERAALRQCKGGAKFLFARLVERPSYRPSMPALPGWTATLAYDIYASLLLSFGTVPAKQALLRGELVLLALRRESSTLAYRGHGSYDDHIVVLNGLGRRGRAVVFAACTEPGAQYSQRASLQTLPSNKPLTAGPRPPRLAATRPLDSRYAGVGFKHSEGVDVDKDGIRDAGRLMAGTYQYFEKHGGHLGARAFQVKVAQLVERDTDGDGRFTTADPQRIDAVGAGTSMYIHRGGANNVKDPNTWSAGCQTIPGNLFSPFLAVMGRPKSFHYVLVNTVLA